MPLKLALPKGRLMASTALLLEQAGVGLADYSPASRSYRLRSASFPDLLAKVFQEKDIPIQVAVGHYDLGICGLEWVEELLARYTASALVKVQDLGYGRRSLCLMASSRSPFATIRDLNNGPSPLRIATEYPNLAEAFALRLRLRRFQVFPVWGAADVYPPENAELALIPRGGDNGLAPGLVPLATLLTSTAFLVANRRSWESQDMAQLLERLEGIGVEEGPAVSEEAVSLDGEWPGDLLRLALPDGHQQAPTAEFLARAGLEVGGYGQGSERRLVLEGMAVKVIRPQDMPIQIANGNFDLAITGQDWLHDHLYRFPSSPVQEILPLGFGMVKLVAVVGPGLPVKNGQELRDMLRVGRLSPVRVASEYINIADEYARDNHLGPYRIIPTWGASEAFLPEDADLLIENTQTGQTLARHGLRIIDTLFESEACLIGHRDGRKKPEVKQKLDALVAKFRRVLS